MHFGRIIISLWICALSAPCFAERNHPTKPKLTLQDLTPAEKAIVQVYLRKKAKYLHTDGPNDLTSPEGGEEFQWTERGLSQDSYRRILEVVPDLEKMVAEGNDLRLQVIEFDIKDQEARTFEGKDRPRNVAAKVVGSYDEAVRKYRRLKEKPINEDQLFAQLKQAFATKHGYPLDMPETKWAIDIRDEFYRVFNRKKHQTEDRRIIADLDPIHFQNWLRQTHKYLQHQPGPEADEFYPKSLEWNHVEATNSVIEILNNFGDPKKQGVLLENLENQQRKETKHLEELRSRHFGEEGTRVGGILTKIRDPDFTWIRNLEWWGYKNGLPNQVRGGFWNDQYWNNRKQASKGPWYWRNPSVEKVLDPPSYWEKVREKWKERGRKTARWAWKTTKYLVGSAIVLGSLVKGVDFTYEHWDTISKIPVTGMEWAAEFIPGRMSGDVPEGGGGIRPGERGSSGGQAGSNGGNREKYRSANEDSEVSPWYDPIEEAPKGQAPKTHGESQKAGREKEANLNIPERPGSGKTTPQGEADSGTGQGQHQGQRSSSGQGQHQGQKQSSASKQESRPQKKTQAPKEGDQITQNHDLRRGLGGDGAPQALFAVKPLNGFTLEDVPGVFEQAFVEDGDHGRSRALKSEPRGRAVFQLETLAAHTPVNKQAYVPFADGFEVKTDVWARDENTGRDIPLRRGLDYRLHETEKGTYLIELADQHMEKSISYRATYHLSELSNYRTTDTSSLPPLSIMEVAVFSELIREHGGAEIADGLKVLLDRARKENRPITADDIIKNVIDNAVYTKLPAKAAPKTNPRDPFEAYEPFFTPDGKLAAQCVGCNENAGDQLRSGWRNLHDMTVQGRSVLIRKPGETFISTEAHWRNIAKKGDGPQVILDATATKMDPRNPKDPLTQEQIAEAQRRLNIVKDAIENAQAHHNDLVEKATEMQSAEESERTLGRRAPQHTPGDKGGESFASEKNETAATKPKKPYRSGLFNPKGSHGPRRIIKPNPWVRHVRMRTLEDINQAIVERRDPRLPKETALWKFRFPGDIEIHGPPEEIEQEAVKEEPKAPVVENKKPPQEEKLVKLLKPAQVVETPKPVEKPKKTLSDIEQLLADLRKKLDEAKKQVEENEARVKAQAQQELEERRLRNSKRRKSAKALSEEFDLAKAKLQRYEQSVAGKGKGLPHSMAFQITTGLINLALGEITPEDFAQKLKGNLHLVGDPTAQNIKAALETFRAEVAVNIKTTQTNLDRRRLKNGDLPSSLSRVASAIEPEIMSALWKTDRNADGPTGLMAEAQKHEWSAKESEDFALIHETMRKADTILQEWLSKVASYEKQIVDLSKKHDIPIEFSCASTSGFFGFLRGKN